MKNKIALIIIALLCAITTPALVTTNILSPVTVSTLVTNGQVVSYYSFTLPPPTFLLLSYGNITNTAGTNSIGFGATISVTPTTLFNLYPLSTNGETDTYSSYQLTNNVITIMVQGSVTNISAGNTISNVQEQIQH